MADPRTVRYGDTSTSTSTSTSTTIDVIFITYIYYFVYATSIQSPPCLISSHLHVHHHACLICFPFPSRSAPARPPDLLTAFSGPPLPEPVQPLHVDSLAPTPSMSRTPRHGHPSLNGAVRPLMATHSSTWWWAWAVADLPPPPPPRSDPDVIPVVMLLLPPALMILRGSSLVLVPPRSRPVARVAPPVARVCSGTAPRRGLRRVASWPSPHGRFG